MADLQKDTAIAVSRSVAATTTAALLNHSGTPEAQQYRDALRALDPSAIDDALGILAAVDEPLALALAARRKLAAQFNGDRIG